MSVVTVQLGQCGNQMGSCFFSALTEDAGGASSLASSADRAYHAATMERFFHQSAEGAPPRARAVLVDMEPKVIAQVTSAARRKGQWQYGESSSFCGKRGSGNNWAHGFRTHGPRAKGPILELVRKEVETCDRLDGLLTLLSLAGGTGSGVGAHTIHALREEYPNANIVSTAVWPYESGEVCVQNYNAVLTLAHMQQSSDVILNVQNDHLHHICSKRLALKKVSFDNLNGVFARQLAAVLLPTYESQDEPSADNFVRYPLGSLVEKLAAHPSYKLIAARAIPQHSTEARSFSSFLWPGLMKHLRQMLLAKAAMEENIDWNVRATPSERRFNHSVANLLVLRGRDIQSAELTPFADPLLYAGWVPAGHGLATWTHRRPYCGEDKFAVMLSNSQLMSSPLERVVGRAWGMFTSRAYVHHYARHGFTEEDFVSSFATLEQVLHDYCQLGGQHVL